MSEVKAFYVAKSTKEEFPDIFRSVKPNFLINFIGADQRKNISDEASTWLGNFHSLINIAVAIKKYTRYISHKVRFFIRIWEIHSEK